ncbi:MAG: T9SS type A sorting domain-containing protein [Ignavibacteria bacterium]|nr:T9SS type A sorting domain-containing protein [Ignavibacteria bacterium]
MSSNNGANWVKKNQGFNIIPGVYSILIGNGYIYAGTSGQSVWKRPIADITGIKLISGLIPSSFSLEQNYPNPFNPVTNLEFGISDLGFVSLKVYDILGKEVVTLVNEKLSPGNYKVEFDGSGLSSGVYFYRLNAGEFTETKRMMLVK